jgi:hypothetical protein
METINAEIFTLTYGSLVRQLLADLEEVDAVNKQLDTMGYNIGTRLIDEFLAKSKTSKCLGFRDAVEKMAKVGFRLFLNISPLVTSWDAKNTECSLILEDNPFTDFVELPEGCGKLIYCNVLCGVIRGALEQVKINVECRFVRDVLRGDDVTEMRVKLISAPPETYPYQDDD